MRNFSWVVPDELAGLAMVGRWAPLGEELEELFDRGIRLLVTLTKESIPQEPIVAAGIEPLHLPVRDFGPPRPEQLETFVRRADAVIASGGAVAVHCFAGMGRTGTFLAAFLVARGLSGANAIAEVRRLRPGSIETAEQEQAVLDFASRH